MRAKTVVGLFCAVLAGCGLQGEDKGAAPFSMGPPRPAPIPSGQATPDATPEATPLGWPRPCHEIYDPELLPTFSLEIAPAELAALKEERPMGIENLHPATFRYEDEVHSVMVRNRGQMSNCGDKLELAIAFNRPDPEHRFRGLKRINLDHGLCRPLRERLALDFARERAGVHAPCANNARLEINGSYYGLYTSIEQVNKEFLRRNFDDDEGNLYKGWEKKTNEENPDTSDFDELRSVTTVEELELLMDLSQAVRFFAAEAVIPARDNYWCCDRNFYVYNHPTAGWSFISHDYDYSLPGVGGESLPPLPGGHEHVNLVLEDPVWRQRYVEAVAEMRAVYLPEEFDARIDRWWAQVRTSAIEDPFLDFSEEDEADPFAELRERIRIRAEFLDMWLASEGKPAE